MFKVIFTFAISIWMTSSIFMLICWANAFITTFRESGKIFVMPFWRFLYIHFCPIVHTAKCFKIMRRTAKLAQKRGV